MSPIFFRVENGLKYIVAGERRCAAGRKEAIGEGREVTAVCTLQGFSNWPTSIHSAIMEACAGSRKWVE
ncbi:MAG: hypothetical protein NTZ24_15950 [Deltaproteobacteria bacterium]|nr:hypothetical protein [Deltaproteobacteria bacterium]